ncbi:MAG: glutaredoxin family protein [Cyanophyceae cyanobacterium]|mgnify:FL=1
MEIILYTKPGCHLCEGLASKLSAVQEQAGGLGFSVVLRDITTRDDWFQQYQYEIPVAFLSSKSLANDDEPVASGAIPLPRLSPRSSVDRVEQWLRRYWPS